MSSNPPEIGTLIVVVLKANHLPNKRHIGKQDPYCVVTVNGEKRRTKAIKRGGQHPEWDEEIRFTLYEDTEDGSEQKDGSPPRPPPKSTRKLKKIKGGMMMKVACFADDPREPDFIGEGDVDLTEVLTKGETDEWFNLSNKEKFAGKVYLELTFWSNEPPPEKQVSKPQKTNKYAGPGYFNSVDEHPNPAQVTPPQSRISNRHEQARLTESVSSALRVPNPNAQSDLLYDPPYLQRHRLDRVSNDFGELEISGRRTSSQSGHFLTSSVSSRFSLAPTPQPTHSFDFSTAEQSYVPSHDRPITPNGPPHAQQSAIVPNSLLPGHNHTQDATSVNGYPHSNRRSRIPTSSSGFVPLHGSSMPSHPTEPAGLASYNPSMASNNTHYATPVYAPALSQSPALTTTVPYGQTPIPTSFTPQPYQSSQLIQYPPYAPPITMPAPSLSASTSPYMSPTASVSPQVQQMTSPYTNGNTPSPTHDQSALPLQVHPPGLTVNNGSRPLPPQPQTVFGQSQMQSAYVTSQLVSPQQSLQPNNMAYQSPIPFPPMQQPPPPPPPPPHSVSYNTTTYISDAQPGLPPPPPPPDPEPARVRRQSSLPRPPINYLQSDRPPPPPPPPLPTNNYAQNPLPPPPPVQNTAGQIQFNHPGPPPKPPVMVGGQSQWLPPQMS